MAETSRFAKDYCLTLAIIAVAAIPFAIDRLGHYCIPLIFAGFLPWIVWSFSIVRVSYKLRPAQAKLPLFLVGSMVVFNICVVCNAYFVWKLFFVLAFGPLPTPESLIWSYIEVLPLTVGLLSVISISTALHPESKYKSLILTLIWWISLNLPLITTVLLSFLIFPSGLLQLYEWFFVQSLSYALAFIGVRIAEDQHSSSKS